MTDKFMFDVVAGGAATSVVFPSDIEFLEKQQISISKEDMESISKKTKQLYMEGTVFYIDSFSHTGKIRWSNFCFYTDLIGPNVNWNTCPIHNGGDWNEINEGKPASATIPMNR